MSRQAAFAKGTQRRQNDDDPDDPMDVMGNILGVNPQDHPNPTPPAPATSSPEWQRLLNQSRYRTGAFEQNQIPNDANTLAQMAGTRPSGPTIDPVSGTSYAAEVAAMRPHPDQYAVQSGRMSADQARQPNWAGVNTQRQNLQEAIAGGAISSGLGIAPGPNDANTLATMAGTQAARTARFRAGAAAQNAIPNDANTLATMRDTAPPPVLRPPLSSGNTLAQAPTQRSTTTQIQYDSYGNAIPDSGGTVVGPNADAAVPVNPSTGLPDDPRQDNSGSLWGRLGNFANAAVHSVPGVSAAESLANSLQEEAGERALEGMNASHAQASGTSHTLNPVTNAMPPIVTGASQSMQGAVPTPEMAGRYVYEAAFQDTVETAKSVITDPSGAAENVWNAIDTVATNPTEVWKGAKRVVPAVVKYYREHPGEIAKLGVGAVVGAATGSFANAALGATTTAVRGAAATSRIARGATTALDAVEDAARVTRPVRRVAGAAETGEDIASTATRQVTRPTVRQAVVEAADRGIAATDRTLNRVITAQEDFRNWSHNLPRRALGMEPADLRIGPVSRVRERVATRIAGDGDSGTRQIIASRVGPTRTMPELPEGTSHRVESNIENYWRRNAVGKYLPGGNPVSEINSTIAFAENPVGYLANRFLHGGDVEDDWVSEYNYLTPGQARGLTRTRRPVSQSVTAAPPDPDTAGFYQRGPMTSAPTMRATSYPDTPVSLGGTTQQGPPQDIGPSSGYQPGRGWKMANSPMYRDEQEPAYG